MLRRDGYAARIRRQLTARKLRLQQQRLGIDPKGSQCSRPRRARSNSPSQPTGNQKGRIHAYRSSHDSSLEGDGFEPSVPRSKESQISRRRPALQDKSGSIKLPIAWGSTRRTDHLGSFLPRRLCLEIGRRGGARGTVMLTFVSSVHNSKIMLGMLIKVLCGHAIATRRRLSRESSVTFEDLMRGASDLDVRSGTIETVTSLRDLWPITVRIVTVITTMRSAVLSCSHETF